MDFELIAAGDPYFANIDPAQNNQPYLSQDLRVFRAAPAINSTPFPGGPTFATDSVGGRLQLHPGAARLPERHDRRSPIPAGTDPFSLLPDQQGEGQTDTSVAPFVLKPGFPPAFANNYNFAIARVRLRGSSGPRGRGERRAGVLPRLREPERRHGLRPERDLRVARRTRPSKPGTPLPGRRRHHRAVLRHRQRRHPRPTISQAGRTSSTLTIPTGQDDLWWYYGCFLNFYDPANQVDGQQVQACCPGRITASSRRSPTTTRRSPTASRRCRGTSSRSGTCSSPSIDNPGPAATHRAPQTFDIRPSKAIGKPGGARPASGSS